jgi:hypothetical protein
MTEQQNKLADLFAACWKDEALKARFMADPASVLKEYGMPVPEGMDVKVVENADNCVHITIPEAPSEKMEISDAELASAAGGGQTMDPTTCRTSFVPTSTCPKDCAPCT